MMEGDKKKVLAVFAILFSIIVGVLLYLSLFTSLDVKLWLPLAIIDSINPCEIAIQATLGASIALIHSLTYGFLSTLLYAFGVVTSYYILGLGIYYLMVHVPTWIAGVIASVYGAYSLFKGLYSPESECPSCVERGKRGLTLLKMGVAGFYIFGLIIGVTISPCTLGPYPIFLTMIKDLPAHERAISLLGYNLVFGLPLFLLSFLLSFLRLSSKLQLYILKNYRKIKVISSLLMIIIGIYVIFLFLP